MPAPLSQPLISVVMPAHNQAAYIGQAIESVLAQTEPSWELLVVDDGSTDDTAAVVGGYLADARVRYLPQANLERSRARNAGLAQARGQYAAFLDADDFWLPEFMRRGLAALAAEPSAAFSVCGIHDTTPQGQRVRTRPCGPAAGEAPEQFLRRMVLGNRIPMCTTVVGMDWLRQAGGFDETLSLAEDWDLWLRLLLRGPAVPVPEALACYRRYNVFMPRRQAERGGARAPVHILEKFFAQVTDPALLALRPAALAQAHWRIAWMHLALGEAAPAQAALETASQFDPAFFGPPWHAWAESVAYLADELYDLTTPVEAGLAAIDSLLRHLPPRAAGLRRHGRRIRGRFWGLHVFRSYEQRQWRAILRAAVTAAAAEPRWLLNRGFVAITLRACGALAAGRAPAAGAHSL